MNGNKLLGIIALLMMLIMCFNPLVDEVTAIGTSENATNYDVMMYNTFPYLYAVMVICVVSGGIYWVWKD